MSKSGLVGFFAYPSQPTDVGQAIELAIPALDRQGSRIAIESWKSLDVIGHFISTDVISRITQCDFFVADITKLNFNVTFEIGYAIGHSKRILLVRNKSISATSPTIQDVGIFDTLGYSDYQNSTELTDLLALPRDFEPIDTVSPLNRKAPVYLLDTPFKTDWSSRIISRVKKSGYTYRSFDPNETPRLSAYDAISQIAQSHGVLVPLLSASSAGHEVHNIRAAFIAGLAAGMDKALCLIQNGDNPVPIDCRDFVNVSYHPDDVNDIVAELASKVAKSFQMIDSTTEPRERSFLKKLNLGATSAENEMRDLVSYYLETDQYLKSLRGEAHLVVGRKGSGKSAIFLQIRDSERDKSRSRNIVLDLKPDGYKLIKFKEQILSFLIEGTYQHTITAFWEYVLLLEICYKILEKDKKRHIIDHHLFEGYRKLADLYQTNDYQVEGDFSERMSGLMEKIYSEYQSKHGSETSVRLSAAEVTGLLYKHDVRQLTRLLIEYMENKGHLWLLFDNIDKGWPASGLTRNDLLIVRALIDATRKIERDFGKNSLVVNTVIFLRNDIYELLIRETSDRGKEASVVLDWTDPDLLRELVRLRIASNGLASDVSFGSAWSRVFISHYRGEETSQYLIERSLMRPRFLLNLINQCKSFAVNLNHELIEESDIDKGIAAYSADLLTDIGYELRDVSEESDGVLYAFIGCRPELTEEEVRDLLRSADLEEEKIQKVFELLLWYGFLGAKVNSDEAKFIYDYNYNMRLMSGVLQKSAARGVGFTVNNAFWPALGITYS